MDGCFHGARRSDTRRIAPRALGAVDIRLGYWHAYCVPCQLDGYFTLAHSVVTRMHERVSDFYYCTE